MLWKKEEGGRCNFCKCRLFLWTSVLVICVLFSDVVDQRVYWMGFYTGDLKSAWYNGSDVKTVVSTSISLNREFEIVDDYVFYTSNNTILKVHKSSGQIPMVIHTEPRRIYGVLFYKQEGKNISVSKPLNCIIHFK